MTRADEQARAYVDSVSTSLTTDKEKLTSYEDFLAGYEANNADLEFLIEKCQAALTAAYQNSEFYAAGVLNHALERLRR
jgi:hypothetical protein